MLERHRSSLEEMADALDKSKYGTADGADWTEVVAKGKTMTWAKFEVHVIGRMFI